jgi:anaerobic dimethyl sulfoxide reductase subunit C (anchor subunit)
MEIQWPLVVFTLLICLGAGTLGVLGALAVVGKGSAVRFPALIVSLAAVVLGGLASMLHLQQWERVFNGFGNPTSGITQEIIGMVLVVAAIVIYLVVSRQGETPKWCGVLAVLVSLILIVAMAHSYAMPSRPLWNSALLYLYYLANAVLLGSLVLVLLLGMKDEDAALAVKAAIGGGGLLAVAILGYAVTIPMLGDQFTSVGNYFDSTNPTKAMQDPNALFSGFLTGEFSLMFWVGALILGAVVPLVVAVVANKRSGRPLAYVAGAGAVSALVGGIAFRALLYVLGFTTFVFY